MKIFVALIILLLKLKLLGKRNVEADLCLWFVWQPKNEKTFPSRHFFVSIKPETFVLTHFDLSPFLRSSERDGEQLCRGRRGGGRGQREPQVRGGRQPRGRDHLEEGGGQAGARQLPRPRHRRGQQVRSPNMSLVTNNALIQNRHRDLLLHRHQWARPVPASICRRGDSLWVVARTLGDGRISISGSGLKLL